MHVVVAAATLQAAVAAAAASLSFSHPYSEFVDRGDLSAHITSDDGSELECPTSISFAQVGNAITLTTRKVPKGTGPEGAACRYVSSVVLGVMAAGTYSVTGRIRSIDGLTFESTTQTLVVLPIDGRCNRQPDMSPSILGTPRNDAAPNFIARVNNDPAFAASLGNPVVRLAGYGNDVAFTYPPLDDIPPAMERLAQSGVLSAMFRNGYLCFSPPPADATAVAVEFHHAGLDHYFYAADAGEIAAVDGGRVGAGWSRTGQTFRVVTAPGCIPSSTDTVVYRFFGIPGRGPNSHFFTRDRAECSVVNSAAQWSLEGIPFYASPPNADGTCNPVKFVNPPQPRVPLYRAWRPFGDSNHRFSIDRATIGAMVATGWVDEGVAMCVLPP